MKSRQMYLGCIITRDDIYIDTWHNVASFQEFEKRIHSRTYNRQPYCGICICEREWLSYLRVLGYTRPYAKTY